MKILHVINNLKFLRVYQSFQEIPGVEQLIVGPKEIVETGFHYGYADCGIKSEQVTSENYYAGAQSVIDSFRPDVATAPNLFLVNNLHVPPECKKMYVSHGMISRQHNTILKLTGYANKFRKTYDAFDSFCVATSWHKDWLVKYKQVNPSKVVINAIPQFDLVCEPDLYYTKTRDALVPEMLKGRPAILYFGHIGSQETRDFEMHKKEFFSILFSLVEIAEKNNFVLFVRPRTVRSTVDALVKPQFKEQYESVLSNPRVVFIDSQYHAYQYMFADVILCNAYSTSEVEGVIAKKPVIMANFVNDSLLYDAFKLIKHGAELEAKDHESLEKCIIRALFDKRTINAMSAGRKQYLTKYNIIADGKHYRRVLDEAKKIFVRGK